MASNNSYSIEGWADRMAAHLQGLNIKAAEIEKQTAAARQPLIVSEQVINFLKEYEAQGRKKAKIMEIKHAGDEFYI
jgi:hypothetical protein